MIKEKDTTELPTGWVSCNIEDVSISLRRGPFGSAIKKAFFVKEGYKVYEQRNAIYKSEKIGNYFISENKFNELVDFEVLPLDFILSCSGTIGKLYQVPKKAPKGIINQALMRIRIDSQVMNYDYFSYLFDYGKFIDAILVESRGVAIKNIVGIKDFKNVEIKLPPINEQNRIVLKLDELLSELEKGKEQLQTSLEQLKGFRQSILKHAFEGKLSEEWRNEQKKLKTSLELVDEINEYLKAIYEKELKEFKSGNLKVKPKQPTLVVSQKTSTSRNSANIPSEWCRIVLNDLSEKITDGTHHTPEYKKDGIHFISVKDIYDGKVHFDNTRFISESDHNELIKRCNPESGDVLITKSGTIGRLAIVPKEPIFSLFVSVALIKQYKDLMLDKYLLFVLEDYINSIDIKQDIKGGVIKNFHLEDLRLANIPFCSIEEQEFIVNVIESKLSIIQDLERTIIDGLVKSDSLKQGLLQKAFEGKLVDQDPKDETAIVLLQRIKKEREEFLNVERERKKTKKPLLIKARKMAEELKQIIEILKESKEPVSAKTLWLSSTHKDDIDEFYAALKTHIEADEIIELPRNGKESFLKLVDLK